MALAPSTPLTATAPLLSADLVAQIDRRWKYWLPFAMATALGHPESTEFMKFMRDEHRRQMVHLSQHNVPMRTIIRHRLDDPRPLQFSRRDRALGFYLTHRRPNTVQSRKRDERIIYPTGARKLSPDGNGN